MNCKWVSRKDKNLKCNRHADSSGYCLFHKQNKSKREIALFDAYIKKGQISNFTGFYISHQGAVSIFSLRSTQPFNQ